MPGVKVESYSNLKRIFLFIEWETPKKGDTDFPEKYRPGSNWPPSSLNILAFEKGLSENPS